MLETLPKLENTGEVEIGAFRVARLALGAMRLLASDTATAECFADPVNPEANRALVKAAVERCGIGYIDFARGYGARPGAGERWFREWMEPYPEDLLWASKVGYERDQSGGWLLNLSPDFLRREIELSLEVLGSPLPLCYLTADSTQDVTVLNRPPSVVDSFRPLLESYERGELSHLGVANVTAAELRQLVEIAPIAVVQNKFTVASLARPESREVLEICRELGIPFVAWGVFQSDDHTPWAPGADLVQAARELSMTPQELSIAVLLQAASNLVVLTGASRPTSLASSIKAANQKVPAEILQRFTAPWKE